MSTGTYQCGERECGLLFTVTTKTPLHSTKLPLIKWLEAMWFVVEMPKGLSSVTLAKVIGVTQKTAWKMGHAIRLLMEQHGARKLDGVVEVDEKYLGGKPRKRHGVKHPRGRGTAKQGILVAVERGGGQVRAALIEKNSITDIGGKLRHMVEKSAHLMTDENSVYRIIGRLYAKHEAVKHKGAIYAVGNVHNNTAESFNATLERMKIGTYHWMSKDHMTRYLAEAVHRWNTRGDAQPVQTKSGKTQIKFVKPPFEDRVAALLAGSLGKRLTWTAVGGIA